VKARACVVSALLTAGLAGIAPAEAGPGQLPVGPGGLATPNVTHLLNVPTGVGVGGGFIGSTYFQTSAEPSWFIGATRAPTPGYGLTGGGLLAFDASDPEAPVLAGALPIPHQQNEDVSLSAKRRLAVISQQPTRAAGLVASSPCLPGRLFLVDVSVPQAMHLAGAPLLMPAQVGNAEDGRSLCGPGHTASLVGNDQYVWVSGSRDGRVYVVDIRDLTQPSVVGSFRTPAGAAGTGYAPGAVHDVDVDRYGDVWVAGSGGTAVYRLTKNPLQPTLVAATTTSDARAAIQLIHHGSQRLDRDHVLVAEEDYQANCDNSVTEHQDGSLQSWRIDRRAKRLRPLASYDAPRGADKSGPLSVDCSSHWFTINKHKVVADAWYAAGVRFVDVSDPRHLRPIGVWRGDSTIAGQARFVPGRPDLVYVSDYARGLDVIKIANGGKGARTAWPQDEKPVTGVGAVGVPGLRMPVRMHAHEDFGWACAVPEG
jgi:hypothetical protein